LIVQDRRAKSGVGENESAPAIRSLLFWSGAVAGFSQGSGFAKRQPVWRCI
jgi:hypothetical protein